MTGVFRGEAPEQERWERKAKSPVVTQRNLAVPYTYYFTLSPLLHLRLLRTERDSEYDRNKIRMDVAEISDPQNR